MKNYPRAYSEESLLDIINSNNSCSDVTPTEVERLLTVARGKASARGNPLEDEAIDCLIATNWTTFAEGEFGRDSDDMINQFALGELNPTASSGKGATLFEETYVIQANWLKSGDGRKTDARKYVDDDYDSADRGDMWVPNGAQDYMCIVELPKELVHESPTLSDAM